MLFTNPQPGSQEPTTDEKTIEAAEAIQEDTKEAIRRIQRQAAETQELGATTLEELYQQRQQLDRIQEEQDHVETQLNRAERLQDIFSVWSLKFNRRAARRSANQVAEREKEQEKRRQKRLDMIEESITSSNTTQEEQAAEVVITPHGRQRRMGGGGGVAGLRSNNNKTTKSTHRTDKPQAERHPGLQKLDENDAEIDKELDVLDTQLDDLLFMAETMQGEIKGQEKALDNLNGQMSDINHQQRVVNNRTGRFLEGRARKQYEQEKATNPTGFW